MNAAAANEIAAQLSRGEYLSAADLGATALEATTAVDPEVGWLTGLALARCGATSRAAELLVDLDLLERRDGVSPRLREDILALWARLAKDRALAAPSRRAELARDAAALYADAARDHDSHYANINAATMWLLAGDDAAARAAAEVTMRLTGAGDEEPDYWTLASRAEAQLILGDPEGAEASLRQADLLDPDWAMRGTTLTQLRLVCSLRGQDTGILHALPLPSVAHYTGHMFTEGPEAELRHAVHHHFGSRRVGAVYGSLACGADLVVAECALEDEIELHVVLPCPREEFVARSVAPGGPDWVERWRVAIEGATTVTEEPTLSLDDEAMFAYCDQLAMGFALARAGQLGSETFQLALWDGVESDGDAGAGAAVARWRALGRDTVVVDLARDALVGPGASHAAEEERPGRRRDVRALLFADVKGFSALSEAQLPDFFERVMGELAEVLTSYEDRLLYRNTWGDALYLVFDGVPAAGECALELQERIRVVREKLEWPTLDLRIGAHAGPVFEGFDQVCGERTFYGTHVTRAARIEPRTPPGQVYATANFAALLALAPGRALHLEYVGHVPTAKDYGSFPMYVITRGGRGDG